jgi:hypothetical protein
LGGGDSDSDSLFASLLAGDQSSVDHVNAVLSDVLLVAATWVILVVVELRGRRQNGSHQGCPWNVLPRHRKVSSDPTMSERACATSTSVADTPTRREVTTIDHTAPRSEEECTIAPRWDRPLVHSYSTHFTAPEPSTRSTPSNSTPPIPLVVNDTV